MTAAQVYLLRSKDDGEVLGVYSSREMLERRIIVEVINLLNACYDTSKIVSEEIRNLISGSFIIENWELNK